MKNYDLFDWNVWESDPAKLWALRRWVRRIVERINSGQLTLNDRTYLGDIVRCEPVNIEQWERYFTHYTNTAFDNWLMAEIVKYRALIAPR